MAEGKTLVNAVLGAIVTLVLTSFVPFAPVLGGMAAGYLEGGDRGDGLRVGAISGLIGLIPLVLFGLLLANFFVFAMAGLPPIPHMLGGLGLLAVAFVLFFAVVYTVGLGAAGGWLGNYLKYDTEIGD